MWSILIVSLIIITMTRWVYRWINPRYNEKIPLGSMGFPLLGETLHYFSPTYSFDISPFISKRMKRYGPIFRTRLLGRPVVISTDSDLNYFILLQEGNLFHSWYPGSAPDIFGRQSLISLHGFMYKYLRNMVLSLIGPESVKKLLPEVEQIANRKLQQWSMKSMVDLKESTAMLIFDLTAKKLISYDQDKSPENLIENFFAFMRGLVAIPIKIPGTAYYKCLQGRKKGMTLLKKLLQERRENPKKQQSDFFDYVLDDLQKEGTILTEEIALDLIFFLLFASFETTSLALTVAMKFLTDSPLVLKKLTEEHEMILKNRETADSGITWKEYKSMKYTFQVINETVRLANIAPVLFRKALKDVQFKGYTIPAGWAVIVCPLAVHLNPEIYEDPLVFNPQRWEGVEINGITKNFMAFGGGMRYCMGTDFNKVQMAVFLHCLVTKYRWNFLGGGNIVRTPGLQFPNGFNVQILMKDKEEQKLT